jgi:hypothetical protein
VSSVPPEFILPEGVAIADQMARDAGHSLDQDHVPVTDELDAYLTERGHQVAQDMDLGQVAPEHLTTLGRLDAIAQHPTLDPALAQTLELVAHNLEHKQHPSGAEHYAAHQGHPHAPDETCSADGPGPTPDSARGQQDG